MTHHPHAAAFLALIDEARPRVREISITEYRERLVRREPHVLVDVREDHEWAKGHLPGAMHLGRGIVERDIESYFADRSTPIVCYCGGGYRGWAVAGLKVETDET